jgi:hypothetical protein
MTDKQIEVAVEIVVAEGRRYIEVGRQPIDAGTGRYVDKGAIGVVGKYQRRVAEQAAVLQILLAALPEIAKAIAEPLTKTDRITLVSTGGDGIGASKITGDVAKIMAELPAIVESLSGIDIRRLIEAIPALKAAGAGKTETPSSSASSPPKRS